MDVQDKTKAEIVDEVTDLRRQVQMQAALCEASRLFLDRCDLTSALNQTCQLMVERFGLKMAWIGRGEEGSLRVEPIAGYNAEQDYLESIKAIWGDSEAGHGPSGTAISTGQIVDAERINSDLAFTWWREAALEQGYKSSAAFPLCYNEERMGVLTVFSAEPDHFTANTLKLLESFANLVAVTIKRADQYEQIQHRAVELEQRITERTSELTATNRQLQREIAERKQVEQERARFTNQLRVAADVSTQLNVILNIEQLLYNVVSQLQNRFNVYHVHVYLLNEAGDDLIMRIGSGEIGRRLRRKEHHIPLNTEHSLVARAARTGEIIAVENVHQEPDFLANPLLPETRTEVAIPLNMAGSIVGVLDIQDNTPHQFTQTDLDVLMALAGQIATALHNAQLFERQKQIEATLRENEQRFRTVADFTYDWEYWIDSHGYYLYVSPSCERITGYRPAEFQQDPDLFQRIIHPDDRSLIIEHFEEELHGTKSASIEFRIVNKQGQECWIGHVCQPVYGPDGDRLGRRASNRDITERKQAEDALWRYTARLETLHQIDRDILAAEKPETIAQVALNHIRDMIPCVRASVVEFMASGEGIVLAVHTDGETTIPKGKILPPNALNVAALKQGQANVVHNIEDLPKLLFAEERIFKEGIRSFLNVPLIVRNDLIGTLNVGSNVPKVFSTDHLDVVEEVATSLAIAIQQARLREQAQKDAKTKATLLHEVNHRVKNNLAAIVGLLYAEQHHAGMEEQPIYQSIISDLINRIEGLATVHQMLSASQWSPLPLEELVQQILQSVMQTLPPNQRASISISIPERILVTPKQANSLAMAINEMGTNTAKYALKDNSRLAITVQAAKENGTIVLEYKDTGPGFPEEVLQEKHRNVGIYLIQNIVNSDLRGSLRLHNDNGAVTTIRFKAMDEGN